MSELSLDKRGNPIQAMTWPASSTEYLLATTDGVVRSAAVPDDVRIVTISADLPVYFETGGPTVDCPAPTIPGASQAARTLERQHLDVALPNRRSEPFHIAFRAAHLDTTVSVSYRGT